jgi:hypothetical protein
VKVHKGGMAKRTCFSLGSCSIGGVSSRVSVPNLPEPSPSLFSQLTVRNQSRVSFGVKLQICCGVLV